VHPELQAFKVPAVLELPVLVVHLGLLEQLELVGHLGRLERLGLEVLRDQQAFKGQVGWGLQELAGHLERLELLD
jgi:hypothetical protein